jgi:hypothetical protein
MRWKKNAYELLLLEIKLKIFSLALSLATVESFLVCAISVLEGEKLWQKVRRAISSRVRLLEEIILSELNSSLKSPPERSTKNNLLLGKNSVRSNDDESFSLVYQRLRLDYS